jgi:hypothetical protein
MASRTATQSLLFTLSVEHPEWRPLLALIGETLREVGQAQWTPCVPRLEDWGDDGRPLLDGRSSASRRAWSSDGFVAC